MLSLNKGQKDHQQFEGSKLPDEMKMMPTVSAPFHTSTVLKHYSIRLKHM